MYTETRMFVTSIIHDDRSILDFIDGKYTFLNERLAKFYGIPGVMGNDFRRVPLEGTERSGVLTQASVLTVTSYPTRTSPVLRGKWILENVLNHAAATAAAGSWLDRRQRRTGPRHHAPADGSSIARIRCAPRAIHVWTRSVSALENYNAIGQWRTHDGNLPIDATGALPGGKTFNGPAELKQVLGFIARCLRRVPDRKTDDLCLGPRPGVV